MRLFTAVLLDQNTKELLYETVNKLQLDSKCGSFTAKENLHLTVNFIGETKRLNEVKQAMNKAIEISAGEKFIMKIQGFGKFKRREGDILWVGVERVDALWRIRKELVKELTTAGFFDIDDMEYTPHLTLGRRVRAKEHFDIDQLERDFIPMETMVAGISLMKSERIQGKLVYTEIYRVEL